MLRPPHPPCPLSLTPPSISPPTKRGSKGGKKGGVVGDKTPDVPSFDGAVPCQCILTFLPGSFCFSPPTKFQFKIVYYNTEHKITKASSSKADKIPAMFTCTYQQPIIVLKQLKRCNRAVIWKQCRLLLILSFAICLRHSVFISLQLCL